MIRDPSRPGECAGELNIPVCMQMTVKALPQLVRMLERFPEVRVILDHLAKPNVVRRTSLCCRRRCFSIGGLPESVPEVDSAHRRGSAKWKGQSREFLPAAPIEIRGIADCLGIQTIRHRKESLLPELLKISQTALSVLPAEDRDWIFAGTALTLYPVLTGN